MRALHKVGDGSNSYRWYHDGTSSHVSATSANGSTWTVDSTGKGYGFRTQSSIKLITYAEDDTSKARYGLRENMFTDPSITERKTLQAHLSNSLAIRAKQKRIVKFPAYAPDVIPHIGDMVTVNQQTTPAVGPSNKKLQLVNMGFDLRPEDLGQSVMKFTCLDYAD